MRVLLERQNRELLRTIEGFQKLIRAAQIPDEFGPYQAHLLNICAELHRLVQRNLIYLELDHPAIFDDVLSNTRQARHIIGLLSSDLAPPLLRASSADRLCLKIIAWQHQAHEQTAAYPAALSNGGCAVLPWKLAPLYFFPCMEQRSLLYLTLFFHEFGHLLYVVHKPELDDLVAELRYAIADALQPVSQRNDRYAEEQAEHQQAIVNTWYSWIQELFCDAVGLVMGGPAYLHAFSAFVSTMSQGDFYRESDDLIGSAHPVTWLRVKFLVQRATAAGYADVAAQVACDWDEAARIMGVQEDYHGFYHPSFARIVERTIDDMLTETAPRPCSTEEAAGMNWNPATDAPVRLLNWAWQEYLADPATYPAWEGDHIPLLLSCDPV